MDVGPTGAWSSAGRRLGPVVVGALVAACQSGAFSKPCGRIPDGGCPNDRGGTCEDRACEALYACYDGTWVQVKACPPGGGGGGAAAGGGSGGDGLSGAGGGACTPATIDHTAEVDGCDPDLVEVPDCPVEVAESCHPCASGCEDFFLCTVGGWNLVAYCNQDGFVVVLQE